MGLDMYLEARRFHVTAEKEKIEGFEVREQRLQIAYWRKHPNLHGFIVQTFADGVDDCKDIHLDIKDMQRIVLAVKERKLPVTSGFFFGRSTDSSSPEDAIASEVAEDLAAFQSAIDWLTKFEQVDDGIWRSVVYHASW